MEDERDTVGARRAINQDRNATMNYRHFDFPNSQGNRDMRPRGSSAATGSAGSYMVVMVLVSLLAMVFAIAAVAALSKARPSEPSPSYSRNAATGGGPEVGGETPFLAPRERNEVDAGAVKATPEHPAFANAKAVAARVANGLEAYVERHGKLAGFKPGRIYRLSASVHTPAGTRSLRDLLELEKAPEMPGDETTLDIEKDMLVVSLPKSEWIVEVYVRIDGERYTYRLYHDGIEEYLDHYARR